MTSSDDATLSFRCPQCRKQLQAPANLAGTQSRCPRCQTSLRVPFHSRTDEKGDEYALRSDSGSSPAEQEANILVVCPVCNARLHAAESEIGQKILCPDCGTAVRVVRPPKEPPKKPPRTAEQVGDYSLATEARRQSKAVPASEQNYVAVVCGLCHTRMLATADQVGSRMICPDCGTATVVPPMPPPKKKIDVMAGSEDAYDLIGYQPPVPVAAPRPLPVADEEPPPEPRLIPRRQRPKLPDHPFLQGTFTFPFSPSVRSRTILLTAWLVIFSVVALMAKYMGSSENPASWFICAMLGGVGAILVLVWFVIASATVLTVLRETSEGCDAIEDWPGAVFLDWMGDSVWLFCAMCMSLTPGAAVAWLLSGQDVTGSIAQIVMPVSIFFVFPFMLMSMIETNSIIGMVSWPVVRTLVTVAPGWLGFYVASAALFAAVGLIDWLAFTVNPYLGDIVICVTPALLWLIYFRLLGRLAWYCTVHSARADLEGALDAVLDEDDSDEIGLAEDDRL